MPCIGDDHKGHLALKNSFKWRSYGFCLAEICAESGSGSEKNVHQVSQSAAKCQFVHTEAPFRFRPHGFSSIIGGLFERLEIQC